MILGRPTNLWLGLVAAVTGFLQVLVLAVRPEVDPTQLGLVLGAASLLLGSIIALIANQAPTVKEGVTVKVVTPEGEPDRTVTV